MTREEILGMSAGRKLDVLVGKKFSRWWQPIDGLSHLPRYSTDISAAWEVVEKLSSQRLRIELTDYMDGEWLCALKNQYGGYVVGEMKFNSAPEAICKIALLAVMEGKDEES